MNWKPMSEAPRDGRQIVAWFEIGGYALMIRWDQELSQWYGEGFDWADDDFTHWAPIEPPKEDE